MPGSDPLSVRQLEVFIALVDHGSFTKAARHLGLSQSTVSGHIADLERRLGVQLVGRERSGVEPSAAGRTLLPSVREVLRSEQNARMAAAELTGLLRGSLTIGGSTIPAVYVIPPLLVRFRREHEGISLRVRTGDSQEVVEFVAGGEVDIGIVGSRPRRSGLEVEPLGGDALILILAPDHELARRSSVTVAEVAAHPIVMREPGSGTRQSIIRAIDAADGAGELNVACEVGSTEAVKATVGAGLGISFVSDLAVRDELEHGRLVTVAVDDFSVKRAFHIISRKEEELSPAGRAFRAMAMTAPHRARS